MRQALFRRPSAFAWSQYWAAWSGNNFFSYIYFSSVSRATPVLHMCLLSEVCAIFTVRGEDTIPLKTSHVIAAPLTILVSQRVFEMSSVAHNVGDSVNATIWI